MESENKKERSLPNSKSSNKVKRICINWEDFGIENENKEGDENYYCYFYTKSKFKPRDNFVLDKNHDPEVKKNDYGALYINYDVPSLDEVRFCLTNKKMTDEEAKNATPKTKKEVGWYTIQNSEILEYDEENDGWGPSCISCIVDNADHLKHDKFLMRFNNCSEINISGDKFKQIISADLGMDIDNIDEDKIKPLKVYVLARFDSSNITTNSYWHWHSEPCSLSDALKNNFETKNCCNGYMKDILSLYFCITRQNLDVHVGKYPSDMGFITRGESVFELKKVKEDQGKDKIVLLHKNKPMDWESVDAEITLKEQINNSSEWQKYKYTSKAKVGLIKSFFQNHIGKTIIFALLSIGVGLYFGWLYALIPIAALIVFVILDQICNCFPETEAMFCCLRSSSTSNHKEEKEKSPELVTFTYKASQK